ncbi:MAG TPA: hypothetical protein VFN57_13440 [Thermomicrobiaceae bacterium]|nr:hypothetical protein [Thermomicrobiaceae bacterium]
MTALAGLCSLGLWVLVGCAARPTSTPTPEAHESFTYANFGSIEPRKDNYRPGDVLTLRWDARSTGAVHQAKPERITMLAGLYGPFDTVDQLKQQMSAFNTAGRSVQEQLNGAVVRIDPVQTDSWTNETYTSTLKLPGNLAPGYYDIVRAATSTSDSGSTTGTGQTIIQISGS